MTTVLLTEKPDTLINGLNADTYVHHYGSDFGEVGNKSASDYSMVKFSFDLHRPFSFFMWKILFPLIIVMLTGWIALLLSPTRIEARTANYPKVSHAWKPSTGGASRCRSPVS